MKADDPAVRRRIRRLRALVLDVDGVMTDGSMYYGPDGEALKKFNTKDGMGLAMLREQGLRIALITGEDTPIVNRRAEKLKIEDVYTGVEDKVSALQDFLTRHNLTPEETGYVGDDVNDLGAMKMVSVAFTVADAAEEVRKVAHVISELRGGEGAVREISNLILRQMGVSGA